MDSPPKLPAPRQSTQIVLLLLFVAAVVIAALYFVGMFRGGIF